MSAFTVSHPDAPLNWGTIPFTKVITNVGGHYSTSTGIFTCQYSGLYYFALHTLKIASYDYLRCYIRKNLSDLVQTHTNPDSDSDSGWYGSTNSVVLQLVQGDTVDVGSCSPHYAIYSETTPTFSGFLIQTD